MKWVIRSLCVVFIINQALLSQGDQTMRIRSPKFPKQLIWANTDPITMEDLKGHVVVLDFWTYCCINCIHVLPDLKYLEDTFADDPVVVIGVHSPKFENEKEVENVRAAVARYEIHHPVAMDNDHRLWQEYGIRAWPSFAVIDTEGRIVGTTSGEGQRDVLEQAIRIALQEGRENGTLAAQNFPITLDMPELSLLSFPGKIEIDSNSRHMYISNSNRNQILMIEMDSDTSGSIVARIGSGESGFKDGSFRDAAFRQPQGLVVQDNTLYVADTENHAVRVVDFEAGTVKTLAGNGQGGYRPDYSGDALATLLNSPWDLEIADNVLYIAMAGNHQLWQLDLETNVLSALVGNGRENIVDGLFSEANLAQPSGLSLTGNRLFFADSEVSGIRVADLGSQTVKTLVGKGLFEFGLQDGPFRKAKFQHALGIDYADDKLYVADTYNHAIRVLDLKAEEVSTLIQRSDQTVCTIDDKSCALLPLFEPNDVLYFEDKLYIADTNNHLIRVFDLATRELVDFLLRAEG